MKPRPVNYAPDDKTQPESGVWLQFLVDGRGIMALVELEDGSLVIEPAKHCWFTDVGGDDAPVEWQITRCRLLGV